MKTPTSTLIACTIAALISGPVLAEGSAQHSSASLRHSVQAGSHSINAGAKTASAAAAVPFTVSASGGTVSGRIATDLWAAANAPIGEPLPLGDETLISMPSPEDAMHEPAARP